MLSGHNCLVFKVLHLLVDLALLHGHFYQGKVPDVDHRGLKNNTLWIVDHGQPTLSQHAEERKAGRMKNLPASASASLGKMLLQVCLSDWHTLTRQLNIIFKGWIFLFLIVILLSWYLTSVLSQQTNLLEWHYYYNHFLVSKTIASFSAIVLIIDAYKCSSEQINRCLPSPGVEW